MARITDGDNRDANQTVYAPIAQRFIQPQKEPPGNALKFLKLRGLQLAYRDEGTGTPVVMVHCSSGNHRMWLPYQVQSQHRLVAPDLYGYGQSEVFDKARAVDNDVDIEFVTALVNKLDSPVHLVGHSYGGAVVLEVLRNLAASAPEKIKSACLIEPVAFHLLKEEAHSQKEWRAISNLGQRFIHACGLGKIQKASRMYMQFWVGRVGWWWMGRRNQQKIQSTVLKVASEFEMAWSNRLNAEHCRAIQTPTLLMYGSKTPRPAKRIIELLRQYLPHSEVSEIPKAGHLCPMTHVNDVRAQLLAHWQAHA